MSNLPESPAAPAASIDTTALRALAEAASADNHGGARAAFRTDVTPAAILRLLDTIDSLRVRVTELDQASDLAIELMNAAVGAGEDAERELVAIATRAAPVVGGSIDTPEPPPLPAQIEEMAVYWICEDCAGYGHVGELQSMGHFQPPEASICGACSGNGRIKIDGYCAEQMHAYARLAIDADRARIAQSAAGGADDPDGYIVIAMIGSQRTKAAFKDIQAARAACIAGNITPYWTAPTPPAQPAPALDAACHLAFIDKVINVALDGCDLDGGTIQEWAILHGLLIEQRMTKQCGDKCQCAEVAEFPATCCRKAYLGAPDVSARDATLVAEARAVFDLMLDGCTDTTFGDYQNGHGETIGPRMDALHAALKGALVAQGEQS